MKWILWVCAFCLFMTVWSSEGESQTFSFYSPYTYQLTVGSTDLQNQEAFDGELRVNYGELFSAASGGGFEIGVERSCSGCLWLMGTYRSTDKVMTQTIGTGILTPLLHLKARFTISQEYRRLAGERHLSLTLLAGVPVWGGLIGVYWNWANDEQFSSGPLSELEDEEGRIAHIQARFRWIGISYGVDTHQKTGEQRRHEGSLVLDLGPLYRWMESL